MKLFVGKSVPHEEHRYNTVGDWFVEGNKLVVLASATKDPRYSFLVALHELVEARLCVEHGVAEEAVSEFDKGYEAARKARTSVITDDEFVLFQNKEASGCYCLPSDDSEPGDDIHAPYHHEHQIATQVERIVAEALGVHWPSYEDALGDLYE